MIGPLWRSTTPLLVVAPASNLLARRHQDIENFRALSVTPTMFMALPLDYGATHVDGPIAADDQIYYGWQLNWYYPDSLAPLFTGGTCHTIDSALVSAVITNTFEAYFYKKF